MLPYSLKGVSCTHAHTHTHTHTHTHSHTQRNTPVFSGYINFMSALLTKIINMKEGYKPLLTLWFLSWSKNFELFEEIFAIFAFVPFLGFFHSVKEVAKPSIFCEIMCVSKRTLVILIRMLYWAAFFKAKKFCNFVFTFICMIYKWGGDFIGSNFARG